MVSAIQKINLKDGVSVRLLITPSLFSIASRKGISLEVNDQEDLHGTLDLYIKIMWLAAINYNEAERMDNPDIEELPYKYLDFAQWAGEHRSDFYKMVAVVAEALSGKSGKDPEEQPSEKPLKKKSGWLSIGKR